MSRREVLAGLLLGASGCIGRDERGRWEFPRESRWRSYRVDRENSGFVSGGVVEEGSLEMLWSVDRFAGSSHFTVSQGRVVSVGQDTHPNHLTGDFEVYALDVGDGDVLWKAEVDSEVRGKGAISGGFYYVGDVDGRLYSVDIESGEIEWSSSVSETRIAEVNEQAGRLIVASVDGAVSAVEPGSGDVVWRVEGLDSHICLSVNRAFVSSADGLEAIEISSGDSLWENDSVGGGVPVYSDGDVYLNSSTGVTVVEASDGGGTRSFDGYSDVRPLAVSEDRVFGTTAHGEVFCLDKQSGEEVWVHEADTSIETGQVAIWEGPVIVGETVYYVLPNPRGTMLKSVADRVFPIRTVNALDSGDGTRKGSHSFDADIRSEPVVLRDKICVATRLGSIIMLKVGR